MCSSDLFFQAEDGIRERLVTGVQTCALPIFADPKPLSEDEIKEAYACFDTEDFKTGYQAFLDKKKPDFEGR